MERESSIRSKSIKLVRSVCIIHVQLKRGCLIQLMRGCLMINLLKKLLLHYDLEWNEWCFRPLSILCHNYLADPDNNNIIVTTEART